MITEYDAHVIAYMNQLWREYLDWKLNKDNYKFWLESSEITHH